MSTGFMNRFWDETPDAIIAISSDGEVLHWNRGAEVIFGYSSEEAKGHIAADLIVPHSHLEEAGRLREELLQNGIAVYEAVRRARTAPWCT